jgi:hypothetical protein
MRFAQHHAAAGRGDVKVIDSDRRATRLSKSDAAYSLTKLIHGDDRFSEGRHAQERGAPICDAGEIVDEPAERRLHLIERADHHHELAEIHRTLQVGRCRHQDRRDDREPAVAGGDPRQPRHGADDAARDFENSFEYRAEALSLIGLAAVQGYAFDLFVDAHQGEAKIRFSRVALGIETNQRATHEPTHERCGPGIDERAPHQIAWRGEHAARDRKELAARQRPKDADK